MHHFSHQPSERGFWNEQLSRAPIPPDLSEDSIWNYYFTNILLLSDRRMDSYSRYLNFSEIYDNRIKNYTKDAQLLSQI